MLRFFIVDQSVIHSYDDNGIVYGDKVLMTNVWHISLKSPCWRCRRWSNIYIQRLAQSYDNCGIVYEH